MAATVFRLGAFNCWACIDAYLLNDEIFSSQIRSGFSICDSTIKSLFKKTSTSQPAMEKLYTSCFHGESANESSSQPSLARADAYIFTNCFCAIHSCIPYFLIGWPLKVRVGENSPSR